MLAAAAQCVDLARHSQAVVHEADFAASSIIPARGNFTQTQSGAMRKKKQFNIESETFDASGFQNRAADIEPKCFETALGIPKWQAGPESYNQIKNAARLLPTPGLMDADQIAEIGRA